MTADFGSLYRNDFMRIGSCVLRNAGAKLSETVRLAHQSNAATALLVFPELGRAADNPSRR